jgi:HAD superfamily phosphoserine phosphatase-like hydrolase
MIKKKKKRIAIFDIDGTIFRKNLHFELINELSWMKIFPKNVRQQLTEVYSGWLTHEGTYEDYRKALVRLYSEHLRGCLREDVLRASRIVVPFHARRTYIFAEGLISKLRLENYHLLAISGSPSEVVEEYNSHYLKFDRAIGSVYAVDKDGRYSGLASFEPSKNKGKTVREYIKKHNLTLEGSYGIGDTESDVSFLAIVENPIAFNPNQNLKAAAEREGWKIVIENKDVVYEIDPKCYREPQFSEL